MINWKVRFKNPAFWQAFIPAIALVVQAAFAVCGMTIDLGTLVGKLVALADAVFVVLALLGIVNDPTTKGMADSARALTYNEPHEDKHD